MSKTVDSRVVKMRFDNQQFEQNARTTMSTLDKLKAKLNFKGATEGLSEINQEAERTKLNPLVKAVATVESKFSAMQVAAITALANITNSAVNAGKRIISALTIDPIKTGFQEYETQINAIQTILANTESKGSTLEDVNAALDELNTYADKTIYNFTEMTRNIGTFTAAGIDLDTSVSAIKGIANLAAVSGSTSQQASTAMYQLSQALSAGTVKLQDWNSVVNAGMGGQVFQDALKETARVHGIAIDQIIKDEGSFRNSLQRGWITSEILTETLSKFTGDLNEEQLRTMGYSEEQIKSIVKMGQTANDAATKVKTFTQLFDTLKEAAQSGWTQSWEIIVGDFEEAKELLTNISDVVSGVIGKAAEARNNLLQGWKDLGGRKKLIESFWTIWNSVSSVVKSIKDAFREIFPPMTAEKLFNITKGFGELVDRLKPSEELLDKIKRTFKGFFAVLNIFKNVLSSIVGGILGGVNGQGKKLLNTVMSLTAKLGDFLVVINESISSSTLLRDIFSKLTSGIVKIVGGIKSILDSLIIGIKGIKKNAETEINTTALEKFKSVLDSLGDKIASVKQKLIDFTSGFKDTGFGKFIFSLVDFVSRHVKSVLEKLGDVFVGWSNKLNNLNFETIEAFLKFLINTGAKAAVVTGIVKFLNGVKNAISGLASSFKLFGKDGFLNGLLGDIRGITSGLKGVLDGLRGCFEAYQQKIKANTLMTIAKAIAILAGSLILLSFVDNDRLTAAIFAITTLFGELMLAMKAFTFIMKSVKTVPAISAAMISMSSAILILSFAMKTLGSLDGAQLVFGVLTIGIMLAMLTKVTKELSKNSGQLTKGTAGLIAFAIAIRILASSCVLLGQLNWKELGKGLIGIFGLIAGITVFTKSADLEKKLVSVGLGVILLATGIRILASSCKIFARMKLGELMLGIDAVGVLLVEIAAFTQMLSQEKKLIAAGIALIGIATAIRILASALSVLASLSWKQIALGLGAVATLLAEIIMVIDSLPEDIITRSLALMVIAVAIASLALTLKSISALSWGDVVKGLIAIGGSLAILATGLEYMADAKKGAIGLVAASVAIFSLGTALKQFANMKWGTIFKMFVSLAGTFALFGLFAKLLGPLIPKMVLLGTAMSLCGAGCLMAAVAVQVLAVGFQMLCIAISSGVGVILSTLYELVTGLANIRLVIFEIIASYFAFGLEMFVTFLPKIAEALTVLISVIASLIIDNVPTICKAVGVILGELIKLLVEYTPKLVEAAFAILVSILKTINDNIYQITVLAIEIIIKFIDGLNEKLPDLIQAAFDLVIAFINGLSDALDNNTERLVAAAWRLVKSLIKAIFTAVKTSFKSIKELGKELMESNFIQGIKDKVSGIWTTFKDGIKDTIDKIKGKWNDFKDAGKELINGLKDGITERFSKIWTSVKESCNGLVDKVKDVFGIHSPSKVFEQIGEYLDEGLAVGIEKFSGYVNKSGKNMCVDLQETVQEGFGDLSNITSGIDSTPTITPVLDLSKVEEGAKRISGIFSNRQAIYAAAEEATNREARATGTTINMTINASEGQDVRQLADIIAERINNSVRRTANAWK